MTRDGRRLLRPGMRLLLAAWLCGRALVSAGTTLPNYAIHTWQAEDGLPQNTVMVILQSQEGYLWLGTLAGLVRFDGVRFTVFDSEEYPELKNGRITALYQDAAGTLWIGHETGDLSRLTNGCFESVEVPAGWSEDVVSCIAADEAGDIWIQSRQGRLARLRDGRIIPPVAGAISSYGLGTMAQDRDGRLWAWRGGEIGRVTAGEVVLPPQEAASPTNLVQCFCPARDGGLWVVRGGQLFKYREAAWEPQPDGGANLQGANGVLEMKDGVVVIRTTEQGIWLIPPGEPARNFSRTNGLTSNWLGCACEDREGDLWLGSASGGLNLVRPVKFEMLNPPNRWNGYPVLGVSAGRDGGIWAASEGGGLYHFLEGRWSRYSTGEGLTTKYIWSVLEDPPGQVWAATWGGGLCTGRDGQFAPAPGLENVRIPMTALLKASDGGMWIGTRAGLLRYKEGRPEWFGSDAGLKSADVRAMIEDKDGSLWFGMIGGGLGHLTNGGVRQYTKTDGLANNLVQCLHFDPDGGLWIGTDGAGLTRLKDGRFDRIGARQGLPNSIICDIEEDALGYAWMSSVGGIMRVSMAELNRCADGLLERVNCITYGKWDGLETVECSGGFQPAGCRTADGWLLFPTRKGLVRFNPAEFNTSSSPPPVVVEKVLADGLPVSRPDAPPDILPVSLRSGAKPLRVPAGGQRLEFVFTALSFSAPSNVRFHYRLAELDAGWITGDTKRSAVYTHVPPGDYRFQVGACNEDGVWSAPAEVAITVLPLFWQTWWFRALTYASAIAALTAGVLLESRRRHRRRLERLERLQVLERERARIAQDIHDDLGANLTRIGLLSQTAMADVDENSVPGRTFRQIYGSARDLTRALDEIVWAVNPRHDTLDSLLDYLSRFAYEFLGAANVRCRIAMPVAHPDWIVRSDIRHNVFLAFKEVLNNVAKHSGAREVRISLQVQAAGIELRVADDGRGFDPGRYRELPPSEDRLAPGNGLANIRNRLHSIGGSAEITSSPGQGSVVRFSIPLTEVKDGKATPDRGHS
ncbi:MAG: two-component regulator propeller domain-containing protein [Verrucomicrobiota bacterium]